MMNMKEIVKSPDNGMPTRWNYYITDHLGSTRMVVGSNDSIREHPFPHPVADRLFVIGSSKDTRRVL